MSGGNVIHLTREIYRETMTPRRHLVSWHQHVFLTK